MHSHIDEIIIITQKICERWYIMIESGNWRSHNVNEYDDKLFFSYLITEKLRK